MRLRLPSLTSRTRGVACSPVLACVLLACALLPLLAGCGGGGGGAPPPQPEPPAPPLAVELSLPGSHLIKLRAQGNTWIALAERPRAHEDNIAPDRSLLLGLPGTDAPVAVQPPAGWSLIDAALHPSGETSLVLATRRTLRLQRRDARGTVVSDTVFADAEAAGDPRYAEHGDYVHDAGSLLPFATRDAVRLAASGESLVMALRTGLHAVIAYGLRESRPGGYRVDWRTLVAPGVGISAEAYLGAGTFDPFAGMENQFHVALDVDGLGRIGIAVSLGRTELAYGLRRHFGIEGLADAGEGALLTQLDAHGRRVAAAVIDTAQASELHGLRWLNGSVVLTGRVRSERRDDGTGWDGYLATVPAGATRAAAYAVLDVDRGDVLFDAAALPDGRLLLTGATGYVQNPHGRSISESAQPLLLATAADGSAPRRLAFAAGPRHNQLRAVGRWADRWWVGGMEDGPGTHSDDADPSGVRSGGYLRTVVP